MTHTIHPIIVAAMFTTLGLLLSSPTPAFADVEKTDGFICPVFNSDSAVGAKNPNAVEIGGGDYTVLGPDVRVPLGATNADGAGSPGGAHSAPGDSDYTAIWAAG